MTLPRGSIVVSAAEPAPIGVAVIDDATSASVSPPRPRLLEALCDDPDVKTALADGDGGSRSSRSSVANPVGANISHHSRHAGKRSARERPHMYAVLTFN
jgi:hypothetical protein